MNTDLSSHRSHLTRRGFLARGATVALAAPGLAALPLAAAETPKADEAAIQLAVVTGGHLFDVINFHKLFRSLSGVEAYIQHMDDFSATPEATRQQYDVVLFYHMLMQGPPEGRVKKALESLGTTEQGIVVLHHALLAYPQWAVWNELVGIPDRKFGYHYNQTLEVRIARTDHPITRGLSPWTMGDETYTMADAGEGSEILLSAEHPLSMKTLAWTRQFKQSRALCFQSGHDNVTWANPSFREIIHRGIRWCARRV